MKQNYLEKKNSDNGPRSIVIRRILAYSKYFKKNKKVHFDPKEKD